MKHRLKLETVSRTEGKGQSRLIGGACYSVKSIIRHNWKCAKISLRSDTNLRFLTSFHREPLYTEPTWQWLDTVKDSEVFLQYAKNKPTLQKYLKENYFVDNPLPELQP